MSVRERLDFTILTVLFGVLVAACVSSETSRVYSSHASSRRTTAFSLLSGQYLVSPPRAQRLAQLTRAHYRGRTATAQMTRALWVPCSSSSGSSPRSSLRRSTTASSRASSASPLSASAQSSAPHGSPLSGPVRPVSTLHADDKAEGDTSSPAQHGRAVRDPGHHRRVLGHDAPGRARARGGDHAERGGELGDPVVQVRTFLSSVRPEGHPAETSDDSGNLFTIIFLLSMSLSPLWVEFGRTDAPRPVQAKTRCGAAPARTRRSTCGARSSSRARRSSPCARRSSRSAGSRAGGRSTRRGPRAPSRSHSITGRHHNCRIFMRPDVQQRAIIPVCFTVGRLCGQSSGDGGVLCPLAFSKPLEVTLAKVFVGGDVV